MNILLVHIISVLLMVLGWIYDFRGPIHFIGTSGVLITALMFWFGPKAGGGG